MTRFLKQSTAATKNQGQFVDDTDGVTAETGLTIAQSNVKLSKNGGAYAQKNDSSTEAHLEDGMYELTLDTTDTDTIGELTVKTVVSGALTNLEYFYVLPTNAFDAIFGSDDDLVNASGQVNLGLVTGSAVTKSAGNLLDVNIAEIDDDSSVVSVLKNMLGGIEVFQVNGTPSTTATVTDSAGASSTDDFYNNRLLTVISGSGAGQQAEITDYVGSTKTFTHDALATAMADNDFFIIT